MNKQISYSTRTAVKRKLAFISCLCVLTGRLTPTALGQEAAKPRTDQRLKWLQEHSAAVSSIDPSDTDFSDLMPLAAAIGPARVVLLGEQTHGDGATFLAKTRLNRYYGFLGNRYRKEKLEQCRQLLGMVPLEQEATPDEKPDYRDRYEALTGSSLWICPRCQRGHMIAVAVIDPFAPPPARASDTS